MSSKAREYFERLFKLIIMIEKILREETNNIFSDKWYKKVSRKISVEKPEEIDPETVKVFNKIKRARNQHDGEWLPIYEILRRTDLEIGNQKLGKILSKNGFRSKSVRFKGGNPVKCYYIRLCEAPML